MNSIEFHLYGKMYSNMDKMFSEWLLAELQKREWSQADLARAAQLERGTIGNVLRNVRRPGPDVCLAIARALNLSPESIFRKANLLPAKPEATEGSDELLHLYQQLNQADRNELIEIARLKAARGKK